MIYPPKLNFKLWFILILEKIYNAALKLFIMIYTVLSLTTGILPPISVLTRGCYNSLHSGL